MYKKVKSKIIIKYKRQKYRPMQYQRVIQQIVRNYDATVPKSMHFPSSAFTCTLFSKTFSYDNYWD